jgi:hypothetical protein
MARPPRWHATLDASADEACLAVRLYNDPAEPRCFEASTVHMHLAWRSGDDCEQLDRRSSWLVIGGDGPVNQELGNLDGLPTPLSSVLGRGTRTLGLCALRVQ